jgi:SNF2 family DNA or RNA helicase
MTELLEVQKLALQRANKKDGFAWFLEMGLGKTLLDLTETERLVREEGLQRAVVVCPNSFKQGWAAEIKKHGFDYDVHVFESGADYWNKKFLQDHHNKLPFLIVNYEAVRSVVVQEYVHQFIKGKVAKITADESIQLKTYNAAQTKAAVNLSKDFIYKRILSGRPITQGPHDLWAQMRFIGVLDGWNYFAFRSTFCKMGGFKGKVVIGAKSEERLAELINPWSFKAEKKDWSDLPEKLYTTRYYKLPFKLQSMYDSMLHDFIVFLENQNVAVDAAITKYVKLAQIQRGFIIDEEGKINVLADAKNNPTMDIIGELVQEVTGKMLIVYRHKWVGTMLYNELLHLNPARIMGKDSMDAAGITVEGEKEKFNGDDRCRVGLLQQTASKYGHTLIGGTTNTARCSTMVFYENDFSLDARSQIEDRIHRHGQRDECLYIDLVGTSLDQRIITALQNKQNIYDAIMNYVTSHPVATSAPAHPRDFASTGQPSPVRRLLP